MTGNDSGGAAASRPKRARGWLPGPMPSEFKAAFDQCYRDVTELAFTIASASMGSAAAAGVAEQVGLALWRRWSAEPAECARDRDWGGWTARAVRSRAIDRVRKIAREAVVTDGSEELDDVEVPEWQTPDRIYELHELMNVIHTSIASTSRRTREVFVASREPGATVASVAVLLGIPVRNVRYYIGAALKAVRQGVHRYNGYAAARKRAGGRKPKLSDTSTHPEHPKPPEAE